MVIVLADSLGSGVKASILSACLGEMGKRIKVSYFLKSRTKPLFQ